MILRKIYWCDTGELRYFTKKHKNKIMSIFCCVEKLAVYCDPYTTSKNNSFTSEGYKLQKGLLDDLFASRESEIVVDELK